MASITLQRRSTVYDPILASYRLVIEVTTSQCIKKEVFVKHRIRDTIKQTFDDVFVAVATPAQLEDFGIDAPKLGSSYFLSNTIDVVSRNIDYLESVFDDIIANIKRLTGEVDALNNMELNGTFTITPVLITLD